MYCPKCGQQENQNVQYCRQCGSDLDTVRSLVSDNPKLAGTGTKNEIAKALAAKIEAIGDTDDLDHFSEEILPKIEKFFESPRERQLRRMREGGIVALVGFATWIAFAIIAAIENSGLFVLSGLGFVAIFVGIAMFINGYWLTDVPEDDSSDFGFEPDHLNAVQVDTTNELLMPPNAQTEFGSVTENTTRTLDRDKIREER